MTQLTTITTRYSLLPYLYTLFFDAATEGRTVMRSLMMEFPWDTRVYNVEDQFLWGSAVLINPILYDNTDTGNFFFPPGRWFNYANRSELVYNDDGGWKQLTMAINEITVAIRGNC